MNHQRIVTIPSLNLDSESINKSNPTIVQLSDSDSDHLKQQDNFESKKQKRILLDSDRYRTTASDNNITTDITIRPIVAVSDSSSSSNSNSNSNSSSSSSSKSLANVSRENTSVSSVSNSLLLNKDTFASTAIVENNSWNFNASTKAKPVDNKFDAGTTKDEIGVAVVDYTVDRGTTKEAILRNCLVNEHTITSLKASNDSPDQGSAVNILTENTKSSSITIDTIEKSDKHNNFVKFSPPPSSTTSSKVIEQTESPSSFVNNNHNINFKVSQDQNQSSGSIEPKRVRFKSLLTLSSTNSTNTSDKVNNIDDDELVDVDQNWKTFDDSTRTKSTEFISSNSDIQSTASSNKNLSSYTNTTRKQFVLNDLTRTNINNQVILEEDEEGEEEETYSDENLGDFQLRTHSPYDNKPTYRHNRNKQQHSTTNSYFKSTTTYLNRKLFNRINIFSSSVSSSSGLKTANSFSNHPYKAYEDKDLLTGASKYRSRIGLGKRHSKIGRTFRGSYRYSRIQITMAIFKKFISLMFQKSTLALIGALLIHITLGTVYTLSNINSYLTSYMRTHGSPNATYGGSMWISSSYAVGQGFSMVLGGYIEKRFSARLACILGCILHSGAIMSTSWSVKHGPLAVLLTYGFIPGFGCGLAYMTPMSNGFGWYPNRKGLVAGLILAGFGIGTFIFNMAQTAYVNPDNLSPLDGADGYFTQPSILSRVPHLFVFIGTIYAIMQFIGCCLLFRPPYSSISATTIAGGKGSSALMDDERPILLDNEMSLKEAIRTREFVVLFLVYGITTQGVLFVNSMIKEYGQIFIDSDMYLAWTGSMASIANSLGRLCWGLAIDRFSFTQCFTSITIIFGSLMFIMPFEFVLSSRLLYLLCTLGLFGSFSGWMSTYPVHLSRVFGRTNSGMIYGLIFVSQSCGGILTALGAHYLIDHYNRFVPFFCVVILEILGLSIYHLFYPK